MSSGLFTQRPRPTMVAVSREKGKVPVTDLELRRYAGHGTNYNASATGGVQTFTYSTGDYVADTRKGVSVYRIDVDHNYGSQSYIWQVRKDNDSGAVAVFDFWEGPSTLKLWFSGNSLDITVKITK